VSRDEAHHGHRRRDRRLATTRAPARAGAQDRAGLRRRAGPADTESVTAMAVNAKRCAVRRGLRAHRIGVGAERIAYVLSPGGVFARAGDVGDPAAFGTRDHRPTLPCSSPSANGARR
jgi:hypothetical protein